MRVELRLISFPLIFLVLIASLACESHETQAGSPITNAAVATQPPFTPSPAPAPDVYVASGPIVVENQLDITAQREGLIAKVLADTGKLVRRGELLATLDDRQLGAEHDAAVAKLQSISFDGKNWEAKVKMEEVDLSRAEKMKQADLITPEQVEHARFQLLASQNELLRERQDYLNQQDIIRGLDVELEKTRITAPFDGVVARRYVRAGQRVTSGERLFWVSAVYPLRVKFTLPQGFAGKVRVGDSIAVSSPDNPQSRRSAKVIQVSPVVDPSSGTIEVLAEMLGPPGDLRPGMTATVRIENHR